MQLKAALARADELAKLADMRAGGGPLMRQQLIKTLGQKSEKLEGELQDQQEEQDVQPQGIY